MGIKVGFAKAGEMLAATNHPGALEPCNKFAGVGHHLPRVRRDRARAHDRTGSLKGQIENRCKVRIESQTAAGMSNYPAVSAEQPAVAGGKDLSG